MNGSVICKVIRDEAYGGIIDIDIVFVHGLSSTSLATWTNCYNDSWPVWVSHLFPNSRIILLDYPSVKFFHSGTSRVAIRDRAINLGSILIGYNLGCRPVIFICHSLGGILIKELLRVSGDTVSLFNLLNKTIGVIFIATPHKGAKIANFFSVFGSRITKELKKNSDYLIELQSWFSNMVETKKVYISAYAENKPIRRLVNLFKVVDSESADPECKNCTVVPLDYNHFDITKPKSIEVDIFLRIKYDILSSISIISNNNNDMNTIREIIRLPELTVNVYLEAVKALHQICCLNGYGVGTTIVSIAYLRTAVVTKNKKLINIIKPLVERWPDNFSIQHGVVGEMLSDANSNKPMSRLEIKSFIVKEITDKLSEIIIDLNVGAYWSDKNEINFITAAHSLSAKLKRETERLVNDKEVMVFSEEDSFIQNKNQNEREELINECINIFYKSNDIKVRLFCYTGEESAVTIRTHNYKIAYVSFFDDLLVLRRDKPRANSAKWLSVCKGCEVDIDKYKDIIISKNDEYVSPATGKSKLKINSLDENAVFVMHEKVFSIKPLISLSGGEVKPGDSGKPIRDKDGNIIAIIVGRTFGEKRSNILASPITKLLKKISTNKSNDKDFTVLSSFIDVKSQ